MKDYYKWEQITEHIYLIVQTYGSHHNVQQLVLGTKEAAIIDTGFGATGNIRTLVETITSLPITCFLTHMHPDHAGAAMLFDRRYMNPADNIHCHWALTREKRMHDLEDVFEQEPTLKAQVELEMASTDGFAASPLKHGDVFDLGGITLEALDTQGHTEGSMTLFCKEENALFAGDAIAPMVSLVVEHQKIPIPLEISYNQLLAVANRTDAATKIFCGHAPRALPVTVLSDLLTTFVNVLDGRASCAASPPKFQKLSDTAPVFQESVGNSVLIYRGATSDRSIINIKNKIGVHYG